MKIEEYLYCIRSMFRDYYGDDVETNCTYMGTGIGIDVNYVGLPGHTIYSIEVQENCCIFINGGGVQHRAVGFMRKLKTLALAQGLDCKRIRKNVFHFSKGPHIPFERDIALSDYPGLSSALFYDVQTLNVEVQEF